MKFNSRKQEELIQNYLLGRINSEDFQVFEHLLNVDEPFRKRYMDSVRFESQLRAHALDNECCRNANTATTLSNDISLVNNKSKKTHGFQAVITQIREWPWRATSVLASVVSMAMVVFIFFLNIGPGGEEESYGLLESSGEMVQWNGIHGVPDTLSNGGRMERLTVNGRLNTISADSMAKIIFNDGATLAVGGISSISIEKSGNMVTIRPESATFTLMSGTSNNKYSYRIIAGDYRMELLGTRIDIEKNTDQTRLKVNEGKVRVHRLSDQHTGIVDAGQVIYARNFDKSVLTPRVEGKPVEYWRSELEEDKKFGDWISGVNSLPDRLRARPVISRVDGKFNVFFISSLTVGSGYQPPVILQSDSIIHLNGFIQEEALCIIGATTKYPDGGLAGIYLTKKYVETDNKLDQSEFHLSIPVKELGPRYPHFPASAIGQEVVDIWMLTIGFEAFLDIAEARISTTENTINQ
jgi:hypothetical protein